MERLLELAFSLGRSREPGTLTGSATRLTTGFVVSLPGAALSHGDWAMVVAMGSMGVMKMPLHQVIDVVAMWNGGVATTGAVNMPWCVTGTGMIGSAA
jgi:hypothetical protein